MTSGDFGLLVGGAAVKNRFRVDGFETIGWTNPNLTASREHRLDAQCDRRRQLHHS